MEYVDFMLGTILVLVGTIFGLLLGLSFKFDKLQKTVHEIERAIEK